jgi:hypothetical protein
MAALRQQLQQQQQQQQQQGAKKAPPPCPVSATALSTQADTAPTGTGDAPTDKDQPAPAASAAAGQDKAAVKAAAAAEISALRDIEAQLLRLSAVVKSYQGEREQLRQALMAGCAERQVLTQQVQDLTAKLQEGGSGGGKQEQLSRAYWGSLSLSQH